MELSHLGRMCSISPSFNKRPTICLPISGSMSLNLKTSFIEVDFDVSMIARWIVRNRSWVNEGICSLKGLALWPGVMLVMVNWGICSLRGLLLWSEVMLVMVNGGLCSLRGLVLWSDIMPDMLYGGICSLGGLALRSDAMLDMMNWRESIYIIKQLKFWGRVASKLLNGDVTWPCTNVGARDI